MKASKYLLATALAAAASVAMAQTITTFRYETGGVSGSGKAEVYVGSGSTVFVRTENGTHNTGFTKASGSSGCDYLHANGSCYSESRMISEIQSRVTSGGGYNR